MMSETGTGVLWLRVRSEALSELVRQATGEAIDVVTDAALPDGCSVAIAVADDGHAELIDTLRMDGAVGLQTILVAEGGQSGSADFVLPPDVDEQVMRSVITAALDFRNQVVSLKTDVANRQSAVGTINHGQFVLRTLDEARNLATMLALACPNSDLVAIGLQELLINAVEHGNLEITAEEKHALIVDGKWREEVERRLNSSDYDDRVVMVNFQRGERMIAITVQDDGMGFDYSGYVDADVPTEGYRGRGIAMARDLSFSSIAYLGRGNVVEAAILLDQD